MPTMEHLARILLIGGGLIAALGLLLLLLSRLGLGRLPGDIFIQRENFTFYFPLATMILLSIVLTLLMNLLRR
ncbi:MAG: DUF2905 domain-containing protein [Bacillota bacterium]|nr:DUF2905 domain-containing protein [Bacillota bacterium]